MGADVTLALTYVPPRDRPALAALMAIDAALGDVVRTTTEPMLGAIKLAWWRERLEELDHGPPPAEPRLQAIARELKPRGIPLADVAPLANGWLRLFDPFPWGIAVAEALWFRGRFLFALGARILAESDEAIESAGGLWALVDTARHCSDAASRELLLNQAQTFARGLAGAEFRPELRPLSMLAALAARDAAQEQPFEPEGTPGRALALVKHRLTGRLPTLS